MALHDKSTTVFFWGKFEQMPERWSCYVGADKSALMLLRPEVKFFQLPRLKVLEKELRQPLPVVASLAKENHFHHNAAKLIDDGRARNCIGSVLYWI